MITLNSERGLVQVDDWAQIESRPGFIKDLDPSQHVLKAIIGRYVFPDKIRCGLSNCHTPHAKGYLVVTADGHETNIGKDCGSRYFGVDFDELSRRFDRDLLDTENRERLTNFSFRSEELERRIVSLRQSERGADWIYRNCQALLNINRGCPTGVVRQLCEMVKTRNATVFRSRIASNDELSVLEAQVGRRLERPHVVREAVGTLQGFEALYPENDLRELLVIGIEAKLQEFAKLQIVNLTHTELRAWTKWTSDVETNLDRAEAVLRAGRKLLNASNLDLLADAQADRADAAAFRAFCRQLPVANDG